MRQGKFFETEEEFADDSEFERDDAKFYLGQLIPLPTRFPG